VIALRSAGLHKPKDIMTQGKELKKTLLTLPQEVFDAFASLGDNTETRNSYAAELRPAGWTLQSISAASGLTRERVRQIVKESETRGYIALTLDGDYPLPEPPRREVKPPRVFVEPDPVKLARLLELQPAAQKVRSNSDKYREEAEEYTALVAEVHLEDKVTLYRLALRLGVTHGALRFRLVRYGYMTAAQGGSSKVYAPILEANRADH
jgi:hypothetical protein